MCNCRTKVQSFGFRVDSRASCLMIVRCSTCSVGNFFWNSFCVIAVAKLFFFSLLLLLYFKLMQIGLKRTRDSVLQWAGWNLAFNQRCIAFVSEAKLHINKSPFSHIPAWVWQGKFLRIGSWNSICWKEMMIYEKIQTLNEQLLINHQHNSDKKATNCDFREM